MREVWGSEELARVVLRQLPDGTEIAYLRRDIARVEGEDGVQWRADEAVVKTDLPLEEVEASFDALWAQAEHESMTQAQRIAGLEEAQSSTDDAICELYEMMIGADA